MSVKHLSKTAQLQRANQKIRTLQAINEKLKADIEYIEIMTDTYPEEEETDE